jgi:hypothetical protein
LLLSEIKPDDEPVDGEVDELAPEVGEVVDEK